MSKLLLKISTFGVWLIRLYLKNIIEIVFLKNTKWPNNPRCRYPLHFWFLAYNFLISKPKNQKHKIHLGFFIWSSIYFHLFAKIDFHNDAIIQNGVFNICSTLLQLLVSLIMQHSNCNFFNMIY
jgi:hypothetical protein